MKYFIKPLLFLEVGFHWTPESVEGKSDGRACWSAGADIVYLVTSDDWDKLFTSMVVKSRSAVELGSCFHRC